MCNDHYLRLLQNGENQLRLHFRDGLFIKLERVRERTPRASNVSDPFMECIGRRRSPRSASCLPWIARHPVVRHIRRPRNRDAELRSSSKLIASTKYLRTPTRDTMTVRTALLVVIGVAAILFTAAWFRSVMRNRSVGSVERTSPNARQLAIGFITNFFDTLGIGSFATTTAAFKALRLVPDEDIPGTMIIGHDLPVVVQAFIFIAAVSVDTTLMLTLIVATIAGGWLGAGVVARLPRRPIQIGMGVGLLLAAAFMAMTQLGVFPGGGTALALSTEKLAFAAVTFAFFGAMLMIGIGNYAPSLIMLSILGMDPRAAFPIMMGAGALVAMAGGIRFMRTGRYQLRAALGLTLGGIPAVLIAGLLVKSLPLAVLRWVVVGVVLYSALMMIRSAIHERNRATLIPRVA